MTFFRTFFSRFLLFLAVLALAACQSVGDKTPIAPSTETAQPTTPQAQTPESETPSQMTQQGASVAVFLADTVEQEGWTPVQIQSGMLYVNPQPVLTREDFVGVQAGTSREGDGLLALALSDAGVKKVEDITRSHPNKRLALVVGRTMLAAPTYAEPVSSQQLVFVVGTQQNANAAARAIAGVASAEATVQPTAAPATQSPRSQP